MPSEYKTNKTERDWLRQLIHGAEEHDDSLGSDFTFHVTEALDTCDWLENEVERLEGVEKQLIGLLDDEHPLCIGDALLNCPVCKILNPKRVEDWRAAVAAGGKRRTDGLDSK